MVVTPDLEALISKLNGIVPEEKKPIIHDLIQEQQDEVDRIDREVQRVQALLDSLNARRTQAVARIGLLRGSISALRKLPVEILGKIFWHGSEGQIRLPPPRDKAPWGFGHVCSLWRTILWHTPHVWTDVCVRATSRAEEGGWQWMEQAFSRILSSSAPLISLSIVSFGKGFPEDFIHDFHHRVRSLTLESPSSEFCYSIQQLPMGSFDSLECLTVSGLSSDRQAAPSDQATSSFQHAAKLREVRITAGQARAPAFLLLPFAQLTNLDISGLEFSRMDMHDVLSQCMLLVECKITVIEEVSDMAPRPPIALSRLLDFLLVIHGVANQLEGLLQPFVLPSLKKLKVNDTLESSGSRSFQPVLDLIRRSNCALDVLETQNYWHVLLSDPDMEPFFQALHSVTFLKMDAIMPPSVFQLLQDGGVLPKLRHLSIIVESDGIEALFDWLDCDYMEDYVPPLRRDMECVEIWCVEDDGFYDGSIRLESWKKMSKSNPEVSLSEYYIYSD